MEDIRLAIIEDDPIIQESLKNYLSINPVMQILICAISVEEFMEKITLGILPELDLILLDIGLPGITGIEGIRHIRKKYPNTDIVILTNFEDEDRIFKALCAGACSYISKRTSLAMIRDAIYIVYRGGSYMSPSIARKIAQHFIPKPIKKEDILTPRQKQIVQGLVDGLSYKMIGDKYNISLDTVRDHIKRIYRTLEINSKAQIIRKSLEGEI